MSFFSYMVCKLPPVRSRSDLSRHFMSHWMVDVPKESQRSILDQDREFTWICSVIQVHNRVELAIHAPLWIPCKAHPNHPRPPGKTLLKAQTLRVLNGSLSLDNAMSTTDGPMSSLKLTQPPTSWDEGHFLKERCGPHLRKSFPRTLEKQMWWHMRCPTSDLALACSTRQNQAIPSSNKVPSMSVFNGISADVASPWHSAWHHWALGTSH